MTLNNIFLRITALFFAASLITGAYKILNQKLNDFEFKAETEIATLIINGEIKTVSLPFRNITTQHTTIEFPINLAHPNQPGRKEIFIPYYDGSIKIKIGKYTIYNSNRRGISNRSNYALINFGASALSSGEAVGTLTVERGSLISLSKIYVGNQGDFKNAVTALTFYQKDARYIVWGGMLALSLISTLLIFNGSFRLDSLHSNIVLFFCALLGVGSLFPTFEKIGNFIPFVVSFSPIISVSYLCLAIGSEEINSRSFELKLLAGNVFFVLIEQFSIYVFNLHRPFVNELFTVPILSATLLVATCISLRQYLKLGGSYHLMNCISSGVLFASILSDALIRIGFLHADIFTSSNSAILIVITLAFNYSSRTLSNLAAIEASMEIKRAELLHQKKKLDKYYQEEIFQKIKLTKFEAVDVMSRNLHDGILTYLSVIASTSENRHEKAWKSVYLASRYASNEVRLLIESRDFLSQSSEITLYATIANLRRQISSVINPADVLITWDILEIVDFIVVCENTKIEIFRILQEALHNAVFRAESKNIHIVGRNNSDGSVKISIENSAGRKLPANLPKNRGVAGMFLRAHKINAEISLKSQDTGAYLELTIPCAST